MLKRISGILLATIGILTIVGAIGLLLDKEPLDWAFLLIVVVLGFAPLAAAVLLLRPRTERFPIQCPNCGSTERAQAGVLRHHSSPWLIPFAGSLVLSGGWLLTCLWGGSRPREVRCIQCDTSYFSETRTSRTTGIILWVVLILLLLGLIGHFLDIK